MNFQMSVQIRGMQVNNQSLAQRVVWKDKRVRELRVFEKNGILIVDHGIWLEEERHEIYRG